VGDNYNELLSMIEKSGKNYDKEKIEKAYLFAKELHKEQKRRSGEPYIIHPIAVACNIVELGLDSDTVCAALLHDVVEDTDTSLEEVEQAFGADVALMVNGVTKLKQLPLYNKEEQQTENVRKMLLAMTEDVRVIIVKLADRLHNMRTMEYQTPNKQREKSLETMEIYAPIAHRLGIRHLKEELEDLSLRYLDPIGYKEIEEKLRLESDERQDFLNDITRRVSERLKEHNLEPSISGRVKSIYGIYRKVFMAGRAFEEIFDVYAIRIIVDTVIECYNILGFMHDMFRPIPDRFKDYISTPKPNMYQSLHTTVIDREGIPFEIQIRTWDMHRTAEYGIAAHWKYKAGISGKDKLEERLAWVREIIESQQEAAGAEDIVKNIRTDLASDDIFVFTPKGDVKSLPAGSTVVDFAYAIHSAVGNRMIGAKINGRIVPLDYQLKMGEIVEIMTSKSVGAGPNRGWLQIAKTSEARNKIRSWFKKERREENIAEGKAELEKEFRRNLIHFDEEEDYLRFMENIIKKYHKDSMDDFYAAIGYGGILISKLMPRVKDEYTRISAAPITPETIQTKAPKKNDSGVEVEGIDNCLVKFAHCCSPLPGDDIVGFITRGYGVSIHKRDCINVINSEKNPEQRSRWINVHWTGHKPVTFNCSLILLAKDRDALISDITITLNNMHIPIYEFNAKKLKDGDAQITVTIGVQGRDHIESIIERLSRLGGIQSVGRFAK